MTPLVIVIAIFFSLYHVHTQQQSKLHALTRTYARAVAGVPTRMHFDNSSGSESYTLEFTVSKVTPGTHTEIFAHRGVVVWLCGCV